MSLLGITRLGAISKTYRHLNRYHQILRVLFKYGFDDLIQHLHIDQYLESGLQMINRSPRENLEKHSRPQRLRMALEELGPTFVKLGQLLSTRPDFVPVAYLTELAHLQNNVGPFPFAEVEAIFLEETGHHPDELFASFQRDPLAAASISQVHRARTLDGSEVVAKVLRPGIDKIIAVDLEILAHIAQLMEQYLVEVQGHRPTLIVEEFAHSISREIDFSIELANIQRFTRQCGANPAVHAPAIYPELSSQRILVMEFVDGIKVSDTAGLLAAGLDLKAIAEHGCQLVLEQILVHGFFHADPHPGNIFILHDGTICFLDFGQMGRLTLRDREDFINLLIPLVAGDAAKVSGSVLALTLHDDTVDGERLSRDLGELMDRYLYQPLEKLQAGKIFYDLLELTSRHRIYFKPNAYLMIKAISTVEGVGLILDPDLQIIHIAEPFMQRIQASRFKPDRLMAEAAAGSGEYLALLRILPGEIRQLLAMLRGGKIRFEFAHKGIEPLRAALDRLSSRVAFAIVLAALIIGSSLIVLSGIPPKWQDIPLIGLAGFVLSGIMGFWLLIAILRQGKM